MPAKKRFKIRIPFWPYISPIITVAFILGTSALIIAYGRGYRFRPTSEKIVDGTGLLSATSDPTGAQIFIDGKLSGATTSSPSIDPGKHTIRIAKDGYLSWQKDLNIQKEVVSRADAFLFPINPSLSPVTNSGIASPILSSDGTKILYITGNIQDDKTLKDPILWMYELADKPLGFNRDPRKIAELATYDEKTTTFKWSPDSDQILVETPAQALLYKTNRTNDFQNVTSTKESVLADWQQEREDKQRKQLVAFKQPIIDIASGSGKIIAFSPDETKILYEATASATIPTVIVPPLIGTNTTPETRDIKPGNLYVYDSKEDKNYFLLATSEILPTPTPSPTPSKKTTKPTPTPVPNTILPEEYPIRWFPTSRHLILTVNKKIDILEYDRTNWVTVYAGPFMDFFAAPWPGGSRIIIVTNLNPGSSPLPNLYTVNLR